MNKWNHINKCPICGVHLNKENLRHIGVSYYDNGKLMMGMVGHSVSVCDVCHSEREDGEVVVTFTPEHALLIENSRMSVTIPNSDSLMPDIRCACCGKKPHELKEYQDRLREDDEYFSTEEEVVIFDEGTYNRYTGAFYCTPCYLKVGQPWGVCNKVYGEA